METNTNGANESKGKFWRGKRYYNCDEHQVCGSHQEKSCEEKQKSMQNKTKSDKKNEILVTDMVSYD